MGSAFYRIKLAIYILTIAMVGTLFLVHVYNVLQKTDYVTESIFTDENVQISLSYPAEVLSPKNEISYPLTLSFSDTTNSSSSHTYTIILQSPTVLFVDVNGVDVTPQFQFTNDRAFVEQRVFVRPYLSGVYPQHHIIDVQVIVDGQKASMQIPPIEIQNEPEWRSFLSLFGIEITGLFGAITLITKIISDMDSAEKEREKTRRELVQKRRKEIEGLTFLTVLERARKFRELEIKIKDDHLEEELKDDVQWIQNSFSEREFLQSVGEQLREEIV